MKLPHDLTDQLHGGLDALVPPEHLASLQQSYPRCRFAALDPAGLTGLTQVDLVAASGALCTTADEVRLLRTIHLTLRPGGVLLWRHTSIDRRWLADAGFCDVRCLPDGTWMARRSTR